MANLLYDDTPLINADTLRALASKNEAGNDICLLGFTTDNPNGYGRIVLSKEKTVKAIIEHKDASEAELKIRLVNGGVLAAKAGILTQFLPQLTAVNSQNELYLTDLVSQAANEDAKIDVLVTEEDELVGVNDRSQLAHVKLSCKEDYGPKPANGDVKAPETIFLSAIPI